MRYSDPAREKTKQTNDVCMVNSNDHWSRLEEVVLGLPFVMDYQDDPSFRHFYHENLLKDPNWSVIRGWREGIKPDNRLRDECIEDLEGIEQVLRGFGVRVRRPRSISEVKEVATPNWKAPTSHALMARDLFLVLADEIIETSVMVRSRYFEQDLYKELLLEYFESGARWTCAPRARLLDSAFDDDGANGQQRLCEPMFDGAQVLKFGTHLLFNCSTRSHGQGLSWLRRHIGEKYTVHEVNIADNHVDARLLPLRPGVLLIHEGVPVDQLPKPLRSWTKIVYRRLESGYPAGGAPLLASSSIGMNVLSLDPEHVLVQDTQLPLMRDLEAAGFVPVPVRWRHGRRFGGGLHCITLDVRRAGALEDYF